MAFGAGGGAGCGGFGGGLFSGNSAWGLFLILILLFFALTWFPIC